MFSRFFTNGREVTTEESCGRLSNNKTSATVATTTVSDVK